MLDIKGIIPTPAGNLALYGLRTLATITIQMIWTFVSIYAALKWGTWSIPGILFAGALPGLMTKAIYLVQDAADELTDRYEQSHPADLVAQLNEGGQPETNK